MSRSPAANPGGGTSDAPRIPAIIKAAPTAHKVNVGPSKSDQLAVLAFRRHGRGREGRPVESAGNGVRTGHGIVEAGTIPDIEGDAGEPKPQDREFGR